MEHWYVLFAHPHKEESVSTSLGQQGVETYLPTIAAASVRRGRRERVPFFPRYLFIRADLAEAGTSLLEWSPGVTCLVSFGGEPAAVPDEVVALLRERLESGQGPRSVSLRHGDRIRITTGPLQDLEAVFDKDLGASGRVRVLLRFLGRLRYCEVDVNAVDEAPKTWRGGAPSAA